jgi:hypothetical protein
MLDLREKMATSTRPLLHKPGFISVSRLLCVLALACASGFAAAQEGADGQLNDPLRAAQEGFDHPVKYAIYSSAWHLSTNAGLRIVAQNQSEEPIELRKIVFRDEAGEHEDTELDLQMLVPPLGWAEKQIAYIDLLAGSSCVARTMKDDWKLVEISNYTLNPSVRGLIIEDTRSFRIYQCVRSVRTFWYNQQNQQAMNAPQWLMYHFERLPID